MTSDQATALLERLSDILACLECLGCVVCILLATIIALQITSKR